VNAISRRHFIAIIIWWFGEERCDKNKHIGVEYNFLKDENLVLNETAVENYMANQLREIY